jgi:hypothetical protein
MIIDNKNIELNKYQIENSKIEHSFFHQNQQKLTMKIKVLTITNKTQE